VPFLRLKIPLPADKQSRACLLSARLIQRNGGLLHGLLERRDRPNRIRFFNIVLGEQAARSDIIGNAWTMRRRHFAASSRSPADHRILARLNVLRVKERLLLKQLGEKNSGFFDVAQPCHCIRISEQDRREVGLFA